MLCSTTPHASLFTLHDYILLRFVNRAPVPVAIPQIELVGESAYLARLLAVGLLVSMKGVPHPISREHLQKMWNGYPITPIKTPSSGVTLSPSWRVTKCFSTIFVSTRTSMMCSLPHVLG